jgi:hypothetical protein
VKSLNRFVKIHDQHGNWIDIPDFLIYCTRRAKRFEMMFGQRL